MRLVLFGCAILCLAACPKRIETISGETRAMKLLSDTPERETTQIQERRQDVEIDTTDYERTPHVVAKGETPMMQLDGRTARLYGNEAASTGFEVDNLVLIEVIADDGSILGRVSVGFTEGVIIGKDHIDNLGRQAFRFEGGEVNLTPVLPDKRPFKIRATALDYSGVGRVTDVYLVLKPEGLDQSGDELRGQ